MTKRNGTWKWVMGIIVTILLATVAVIGGFIYDYGGHGKEVEAIVKDVEEMKQDIKEEVKPEMKQNTEHRIKFEEKVTTIEKNVGKILTIVEGLEK